MAVGEALTKEHLSTIAQRATVNPRLWGCDRGDMKPKAEKTAGELIF